MKVSFELSKRDIRFFRDRLKQVRASDASKDEAAVICGAVDLVKEAICWIDLRGAGHIRSINGVTLRPTSSMRSS